MSFSSIEHVQAKLDTSDAAEAERSGDAEVEQCLRRQPLRATRLEQHRPLTVLRVDERAVAAHGLPLRCCRLAATTKPVRGTSTEVMTPEHVRTIVGQAPAGVGEIVRILPERDPGAANAAGGEPTVATCAPAAVVPLDGCSPYALDSV